MEYTKKACFIAFLAVFNSAATHADALTADQAVAYALENNPDLTAAYEHSLAAQARTGAAHAGGRPQVNARYTARESNNPLDALADKLNTRSVAASDFDPAMLNDPANTRLQMAELSLQVPIYTGGRIQSGVRQAEHGERAAQLQYQRARETVAAQTRQAYLALQAARRARAIAEDAVAAASEHAQTTADLRRQGRIVSSDKLTAEVNLSAVKGMREQAIARERQALSRLRRVLGRSDNTDIEVAAWQPATETDVGTVDENDAFAHRKDLAAMNARVDASYAQIEAARAEHNAQVNFIATTSWYDRHFAVDHNSWSVMGVITKPIYLGGRIHGETAAARHEANAVQAQRAGLEQDIRQQVRDAQDKLAEAQARLAIARDNSERARQTVGLVKKRYGEGRTILIDLLQAERALVQARNEELAAEEEWQSSRIDLALASGTP